MLPDLIEIKRPTIYMVSCDEVVGKRVNMKFNGLNKYTFRKKLL